MLSLLPRPDCDFATAMCSCPNTCSRSEPPFRANPRLASRRWISTPAWLDQSPLPSASRRTLTFGCLLRAPLRRGIVARHHKAPRLEQEILQRIGSVAALYRPLT